MSIAVAIHENYTDYKHPSAILDYEIDWSEWLNGDTIVTSTWEVGTGLTIEADPAPSYTSSTTKAWFSGGTNNTKYVFTNTITTIAGRKESKTITLHVLTWGGK